LALRATHAEPGGPIREILKRGLAAQGFALADKGVKSKDFGILAKQKAKATKRE
jgi:hypothetical protein